MQTLDTILTTHPEGRFIIFSSYDETFSKIREVLVDAEMEYAELSGRRHETRQRIITDFKEARLRVLFMNSFHDGAGVNLHEATDIILYHEMTDMMKTQIIGRAYRIGRTHPLRVHHLVDDHTTMTTNAPAVVV
jgi:SNF2 family DNA or RNA helicase